MVGPARRVAAAAAFAVGVATLGPAVFTASADAQDADPPGEVRAQLVRTTDTSKFDKPSPDPSGITYLADRGRLLISDSEVEEMSLYRGANLFYLTRWGRKTWDRSTIRFSAEPTGVTHNPRNRHLFTSDDDADRVYEIAPGSDGAHGTSDDVVTSFSLRKVGSRDAEDVVFDTTRGHLLVVDGVGTGGLPLRAWRQRTVRRQRRQGESLRRP